MGEEVTQSQEEESSANSNKYGWQYYIQYHKNISPKVKNVIMLKEKFIKY